MHAPEVVPREIERQGSLQIQRPSPCVECRRKPRFGEGPRGRSCSTDFVLARRYNATPALPRPGGLILPGKDFLASAQIPTEVLEERCVKYGIRIPGNDSLERDVAELLPRHVGRPSQKPLVGYKGLL